ncbi:phosphotransferase family protein [Kribbella sp. CA-253562]|uniref:phosphotransferase family protein n=1 Tax=Kribbella sp. CA-253562 TaxID=3239942 RepID=UPI003D93E996
MDIEQLVGIGLPGYVVRSAERLGAGLDNVAYEVNGELVVRIAQEAGTVVREAALLAEVGRVSPLPVPEPVFVLGEHNCLAYRKVPGTPLIDVPLAERAAYAVAVGAELGILLAALHTSGLERRTDLVDVDDAPLTDWLEEAAEQYADVAETLTTGQQQSVESFLDSPLPEPADRLVFSHNDLGIEHVLVAPGTGKVTGVIDWSDAAVCDPARDFGLILRDLGPAALDAALDRCPDDLRDRAWFYARCSLLEDLHYGLETGRTAYAEKSLARLEQVFTRTSRPS